MMPGAGLMFLVAMFFGGAAYAQVNCGEQPSVPADVQQRIQGDIEGKAQVFTRLLGDINLKGKVDAGRAEVYQKYKDLDKSVIDRYMIWVSCQSIFQNRSLSAAERNQLWIQIYRELSRPPEPQKQSRIPKDLFNIIEIGRVGDTSIQYLESMLGTAKIKTAKHAIFIVDGYEIKSFFLDESSANGEKGTIIRLEAKIKNANLARHTPIILDGYWNPEGCGARGACREDILPLNLSEGHILSRFIDGPSCSPEQEGGRSNNTDPTYFCLKEGYGATNFIERRFEIDVMDGKASAAFTLLKNLEDPELYGLDKDIVSRYEAELGIKERDKNKKYRELVEKVMPILLRSKVVGFAISLEGYQDYLSTAMDK